MRMVLLLSLAMIGMGVVAALSAALYAALPRSLLECAERHGRFHGLRQDPAIPTGTPAETLPHGELSGQGV